MNILSASHFIFLMNSSHLMICSRDNIMVRGYQTINLHVVLCPCSTFFGLSSCWRRNFCVLLSLSSHFQEWLIFQWSFWSFNIAFVGVVMIVFHTFLFFISWFEQFQLSFRRLLLSLSPIDATKVFYVDISIIFAVFSQGTFSTARFLLCTKDLRENTSRCYFNTS